MTEVQPIMEKLGKANKLMEELIDLATEDENISEDEKQMLFSINENLGAYAKAIIEIVSDGVIEDEEKEKLRELEKKIVNDANEIANGDANVSDEEKTLLNQLIDTIQNI